MSALNRRVLFLLDLLNVRSAGYSRHVGIFSRGFLPNDVQVTSQAGGEDEFDLHALLNVVVATENSESTSGHLLPMDADQKVPSQNFGR